MRGGGIPQLCKNAEVFPPKPSERSLGADAVPFPLFSPVNPSKLPYGPLKTPATSLCLIQLAGGMEGVRSEGNINNRTGTSKRRPGILSKRTKRPLRRVGRWHTGHNGKRGGSPQDQPFKETTRPSKPPSSVSAGNVRHWASGGPRGAPGQQSGLSAAASIPSRASAHLPSSAPRAAPRGCQGPASASPSPLVL